MAEKKIELQEIDPVEIFGVNVENTIETIKMNLKTIKDNNENTLSRALDNYSNEHPATALAKEYKICKEFIQNLQIPTAKIEKEEV